MQPDQPQQSNPAPVAPQAPTPPPAAPQQPAAPAQASGYESNPFKLFSPSWAAVKLNLGTWIITWLVTGAVLVALTLIPLTAIALAAKDDSGAGMAIAGVAWLVALVVGLLVYSRFAGLVVNLMVQSVRGTKLGFKEALEAGKPFGWKLIGFLILYSIAVTIGYIFFIIPGIIFMIWFSMGAFVIVDEKRGVIEAFSRSKELVKGRFWEVFGVIGVFQIISVLAIIPLLGWIAALVLSVAYVAATAVRYIQLKDFKDANKPLPKVSSANYAAAVLFVVSIIVGSIFSMAYRPSTDYKLDTDTMYDSSTQMNDGSFDSSTEGSIDSSGSVDSDTGASSY